MTTTARRLQFSDDRSYSDLWEAFTTTALAHPNQTVKLDAAAATVTVVAPPIDPIGFERAMNTWYPREAA